MKIIRFRNVAQLRDEISTSSLEQFVTLRLDDRELVISPNFDKRMQQIAADSDATISYCNYREILDDGSVENHPVNDYQFGSVRDDFDFGSLVVLNAADVLAASEDFPDKWNDGPDGGWYALRLRMSMGKTVAAIPEYMYSVRRVDYRKSGEKQHDYVDPRNEDYQNYMEDVFTDFLHELGAEVSFVRKRPNIDREEFPVEASVVIPVKNRVATIGDAVASALSQDADFNFNVIVVGNCSTDGTYERLLEFDDPRLIVLRMDPALCAGIGGCWNHAVLSEHCGRFAVQLDSDDVYSSNETLQKIVDKFHADHCAMVVGSYMLTDFDLNPIPPGLIDHKEWTDSNGPNNALRINGFGAPRAFFTPVVREILFPDVSYGEDYAMALRISREYAIGRIYEPLYYCRRWKGNSDAALSIEKVNANNEYKDFIRSVEMIARMRENYDNNE